MKKVMSVLFCLIVCFAILLSGCAAQGDAKAKSDPQPKPEPKTKPQPKPNAIVGGLANTGLVLYDIGAMTVNMTWGIGTFGYGFVDGQTLLPLYDPATKKFKAQQF